MPWQEMSTMEQREEFVRLALLEGANRRELCRRYGISPQTGYKWLRRWRDGEALTDRSRRPKDSPGRLDAAAEAAILEVRDAHPAWGARKIAAVLARAGQAVAAVSTVHAVLRRHGRIAPREAAASRDWQRFEEVAANRLWQMDFKGRVRLGDDSVCHPLTVIDDHSRFSVCLAACTDQRTESVQQSLERSFAVYGLPRAFLVDNGSPWGSSHGPSQWTPLRVWLARLGVQVIYARPFHPQTKGKNERFNRTLKEEVLALRSYRNRAHMQQAFDRWRLVYNFHRPHEALDNNVPAHRYRPSPRALPRDLPPLAYAGETILRRVPKARAQVSFKGRLWSVPKAFRGEQLAIRPTQAAETFGVYFGANKVAEIDLNA